MNSYTAPEIVCQLNTPRMIRSAYSNKVDIWSMGIMLYQMFCCDFPFADYDETLFREVQFKHEQWKYASDDVKQLISHMLVKDPQNRFSIDDVLNHPWFADDPKAVSKVREIMTNSQNKNEQQQPLQPQQQQVIANADTKRSVLANIVNTIAKNTNPPSQAVTPIPVATSKRKQCWMCEESFIKVSSFINHMKTDHGTIIKKIGQQNKRKRHS